MVDKRLRRTTLIYRVVQGLLIALLAFVAFTYQTNFVQMGRGDLFTSSLLVSVVVQLLMLYPVYKLAWRDAGIALEGVRADLSGEQMAALRKKRLLGDLWKVSAFIFFLTFAMLLPTSTATPFVLAVINFSFLLACLMYFQCFNFSLKRQMR